MNCGIFVFSGAAETGSVAFILSLLNFFLAGRSIMQDIRLLFCVRIPETSHLSTLTKANPGSRQCLPRSAL